MRRTICLVILAALLSGCAATSQVSRGMTKEDVRTALGVPTKIKTHKNSCCRAKDEETWYYFNSLNQNRTIRRSIVFKDDQVLYAFNWR